MRPRQWTKNAFVLAPLIFAGEALNWTATATALLAAAIFSLLASGIYALNDAFDYTKDRAHPRKRLRPIAAGRITPVQGLTAGAVLAVGAAVGAWALKPGFGVIALVYLVLNVFYSRWLKSIVILDVFAISAFFLLRLLAGARVIEVPATLWLLLCGGLLALYLGFAKRRHELVALGDASSETRQVLTHYGPAFLDQMSSVLLSVTIVAYIMYTLTSETALRVGSDALSYSVVFVLYGVFRYLYLSHRQEGGDPTETLLTDRPLLASVTMWFLYCGWVVYGAG